MIIYTKNVNYYTKFIYKERLNGIIKLTKGVIKLEIKKKIKIISSFYRSNNLYNPDTTDIC